MHPLPKFQDQGENTRKNLRKEEEKNSGEEINDMAFSLQSLKFQWDGQIRTKSGCRFFHVRPPKHNKEYAKRGNPEMPVKQHSQVSS